MPFTTLSWWMLVPKVTEEIGFAAEGGAGWLFIVLPCCTELCEGAVVGKTEQWHTTVHNRLCWLAGFTGTGVERNSILLTPYQILHLCSLSVLGNAMMVLLQRSFSGWKSIHTHRGRTRSPDALKGIGGTLGPRCRDSVWWHRHWAEEQAAQRVACTLLEVLN